MGETEKHKSEYAVDDTSRERKLYIVRKCLNSGDETVNIENLKILNMGIITITMEGEYLRYYL